jgi:DNA helicase HerA-like ATPase
MNFSATDCITVLGTRGTGKSTLARKIGEMWPRQIIIDPVMDWSDGEIVSSFDQFSSRLSELQKDNEKKFRIIFRFDPDSPNKEEIYEHVLRLAFHFKNLQVVTDEVQLFSTPHYLSNYLKNILFIGRHNGISSLNITQRPGQLNKNILAQSLHVFVGQMHEKNDLKVVSDFISVPQEKIINLEKGLFFWFSPGKKLELIRVF